MQYDFNLYLKRKGSSDIHHEDCISLSAAFIAAFHLLLFFDTVSHLVLNMNEVKISSKHCRLSQFSVICLLCKTKRA